MTNEKCDTQFIELWLFVVMASGYKSGIVSTRKEYWTCSSVLMTAHVTHKLLRLQPTQKIA